MTRRGRPRAAATAARCAGCSSRRAGSSASAAAACIVHREGRVREPAAPPSCLRIDTAGRGRSRAVVCRLGRAPESSRATRRSTIPSRQSGRHPERRSQPRSRAHRDRERRADRRRRPRALSTQTSGSPRRNRRRQSSALPTPALRPRNSGRSQNVLFNAGGLRPAGPPCTLTRGDPVPRSVRVARSRGSLASLSDHNRPLVDGSARPSCLSFEHATRSARANALKIAST